MSTSPPEGPNGPNAVILAGGISSRLGRDKALEIVDGRSLLDRVLDALAQVAGGLILALPQGRKRYPFLTRPGLRIVRDLRPSWGPVAGLYSGLGAAQSPYVWAAACDMPFLNPDLLRYLMGVVHGHDAAVPRVAGRFQMLHAVYSRTCLPPLEGLMNVEGSGLHDLLPRVRVRVVEETEGASPEAWRRSCFNINTDEDLTTARKMAANPQPKE